MFETEREEDADELHSRFDNVRVDMDDMQDCFEVLKNITIDTPAEPFFLSILQHLLFIRDDVYIRYVLPFLNSLFLLFFFNKNFSNLGQPTINL